jgi:hypothetical protein
VEREEAEETQRERRRSRSVVARLVEAELLGDDTPLRLNLDNGQLSRQLRDELRAWLDEGPRACHCDLGECEPSLPQVGRRRQGTLCLGTGFLRCRAGDGTADSGHWTAVVGRQ